MRIASWFAAFGLSTPLPLPPMCAIYTHIVRASDCVCVCLDISFRLPLLSPYLFLLCFLQPDNIDYAVFFARFSSRSCCLVVVLLVVAVVIVFFLLFTLN